MGLLLNEIRDLVMQDMEKAELPNAFFFTWSLLVRPGFGNPRCQRLGGKAGVRKMYPW